MSTKHIVEFVGVYPEPKLSRVTHDDCWVGEPCAEGAPASCPLEKVRLARAELHKGFWSPLVVKEEVGGLRHYLDGEPVHAGTGLELQAVQYKADDYGDFTAPLPFGVPVRYEAQWARVEGASVLQGTLYLMEHGHEFATRLEPWMRFRWPKKAWQR